MNSFRRVIKAEQVQFTAGRSLATGTLRMPVPAASDLSAVNEQAQQIVQAARDQAAEIQRAAQESAAETLRQAHAEGLKAAEAEATALLLAAHGVLDEVEAWRRRLLTQSEPFVIELVSAVARKMLGEGLALETEVLRRVFDQALAEARPLGALRVRLNPEDAQVLGPEWPAAGSANQNLELVPDATIRRGGCLIEGEFGSVDARTDSKLSLALAALDQAGAEAAEAGEHVL